MFRVDRVASQLLHDSDSCLWTTKYFPTSLSDIPLYKKAQTTTFLSRISDVFAGYPQHPRVIAVTGPVGCGKTTLVRTVCDYRRIEIVQFSPDEDYAEYVGPRDSAYARLQLSAFLERSQLVSIPERSRVLLIDDYVVEDDFRAEFLRLIEGYSTDRRRLFPLIWVQDAVNSSMAPSNCFMFNFPAASPTVLKRVIGRVAKGEGLRLTKEQIQELLSDNPGDVRLAVNTLQFARSFVPGKYDALTFFQAVGEVLYIKKKRTPEKILSVSHCSPRAMVNSLFENALDFYMSVEEYGAAAGLFSEADVFMRAAWQVPELDVLAATTVMRGIMETNMHRVPSYFSSLRSSKNSRLRSNGSCTPDDPFKCWPHQKMSSEQMDYALFADEGSFQYVSKKNSEDKPKLQPSIYDLEQTMKLLEIDPIDSTGIDDFFGS